MRKIKAWHCDYCSKILAYGSKTSMESHEKNCLKNPANRTCVTCGNFTRKEESFLDNATWTVPACRENLIQPDPNNPKNRYGLRKNCEHWKAKYPGETGLE